MKNFSPAEPQLTGVQFTCGHFAKTNEWLRERYGVEGEIDWDLNVAPEDAGV